MPDIQPNEAPEAPPEWRPVGEPGAPPESWEEYGFTAPEVQRWEREDDTAHVAGVGSQSRPFIVDVRPGPGVNHLEALATLLAAATLPGALFNTWLVAGQGVPTFVRAHQVGAVNGSPAWHRQQLTGGVGMPAAPPPPPAPPTGPN